MPRAMHSCPRACMAMRVRYARMQSGGRLCTAQASPDVSTRRRARRFLAKGITLELLLTQFAHHAHDNAHVPSSHACGGAASPCGSTDSGGDDLDGATLSGGSTGAAGGGADGSAGSGASDDEGSSPAGRNGSQPYVNFGGYPANSSYSEAMGLHASLQSSYGPPAYCFGGPTGAYGYQPPQPQLPPLRAPLGATPGACGSAGTATMFSGDEDDCCDTLGMHFAGAAPAGAGGALSYLTGSAPAECDQLDPLDSIESLLDGFAAAGAAAAAAAASAASAREMDALCGAEPGAGAPVCWQATGEGALGGGGGGSFGLKRDLAVSLAGADDGAASPMKRLRIGASSAFGRAAADEDDELPICYADQRAAMCAGAGAGATAAAAGAVRLHRLGAAAVAAPMYEWCEAAAARGAAPAAPAAHGASAAAVDVSGGCGDAGPLELLDALPLSIRSCLVDAAALYLANDASGLAA